MSIIIQHLDFKNNSIFLTDIILYIYECGALLCLIFYLLLKISNFLLNTFPYCSNVKNPLIVTHCPHGYVLKILNSLDSKKEDFVDAQNQMLLYLGKNC